MVTARSASWGLLALVLTARCGLPSREPAASTRENGPTRQPARPPSVILERHPLPAPYLAAFPSEPAEIAAWRNRERPSLPPIDSVVWRIARGDAATLDRLAASGAALTGDRRSAWVAAWNQALSHRRYDLPFLPGRAFCAQAERLQQDLDSPLAALMAASELRALCDHIRRGTFAEEPADPAQVRALAVRLRAAGFADLDEPDPRRFWKGALSGEEILMDGGRALRFDAENSSVPSKHHELMFELAAIARPALDDVIFEEHVLRPPDQECEVVAYADGLRFRTRTQDHCSDWYDLDAVARLMNALLEHRRAPGRLVFLHTTDQTASLAYGSKEAFAAAFARGLLKPGDPTAAETLGKTFEGRIINKLQSY